MEETGLKDRINKLLQDKENQDMKLIKQEQIVKQVQSQITQRDYQIQSLKDELVEVKKEHGNKTYLTESDADLISRLKKDINDLNDVNNELKNDIKSKGDVHV